jgi:hypothetical protein
MLCDAGLVLRDAIVVLCNAVPVLCDAVRGTYQADSRPDSHIVIIVILSARFHEREDLEQEHGLTQHGDGGHEV